MAQSGDLAAAASGSAGSTGLRGFPSGATRPPPLRQLPQWAGHQRSSLQHQHLPRDVVQQVPHDFSPPASPFVLHSAHNGRADKGKHNGGPHSAGALPAGRDNPQQQEPEQQLHLPPRLTPSAALARRGITLASSGSEAAPLGASRALAASGGSSRALSVSALHKQPPDAPPLGAHFTATASVAPAVLGIQPEGAVVGGGIGAVGVGGGGDDGGSNNLSSAQPRATESFRQKYGTMAAAAGLKATADRRSRPPPSPAPRGFSGMRPMTWGGRRAAFSAESAGSAGDAYSQAAMETAGFLGLEGIPGAGEPGAAAGLDSGAPWCPGGARHSEGGGSGGYDHATGDRAAVLYGMRPRASVSAQLPQVQRQQQPWSRTQQGPSLEPAAAEAVSTGNVLQPSGGSGHESSGVGGGGGSSFGVVGLGQRAPVLLPRYGHGGNAGMPAPHATPRLAPSPMPLALPPSYGSTACPTVAEDDEEASGAPRTVTSTSTASGPGAGSGTATAPRTSAAGSSLGPTTPLHKAVTSRPAPVTPAPAHPLHPSPFRAHTHSEHRHFHHASYARAHVSEMPTLSSSGIPGAPLAGHSTAAAASPAAPYGSSQQQQQLGGPAQDSARLDLHLSTLVSTLSWSSVSHSDSVGAERAEWPAAGGAGTGRAATAPAPEATGSWTTASMAQGPRAGDPFVQLPLPSPLPATQLQRQHRHTVATTPIEAATVPSQVPAASEGSPAVQVQPQRRRSGQLHPHQDPATAGLIHVMDVTRDSVNSDAEDEGGHHRSVADRGNDGQASEANESAVNGDTEHESDGGAGSAAAAARGRSGRARNWSFRTAPAEINQRALGCGPGGMQQGQQEQQPWPPSASGSSEAGRQRGSIHTLGQAEPAGHGEGSTTSSSAVSGGSAVKQRVQRRGTGLGPLGPDPVGEAAAVLRRSEFTFGKPRSKWRRMSAAFMKVRLH